MEPVPDTGETGFSVQYGQAFSLCSCVLFIDVHIVATLGKATLGNTTLAKPHWTKLHWEKHMGDLWLRCTIDLV